MGKMAKEKKTVNERLYSILKKAKPDDNLGVKRISDFLGCTISYISHGMKMARICGFVDIDVNGNYQVIPDNIPEDVEVFKNKMSEEINRYRAEASGKTYNPDGKRKAPKRITTRHKVEVDEENILQVMKNILQENAALRKESKETNIKNKKMIMYIKKQKRKIKALADE